MRDLTKHEMAAIWLYATEYCRQNLSAIDYYAQLTEGRKAIVRRMVKNISEATDAKD